MSLAIDPASRDMVFGADGQVSYDSSPAPELVLAIGVPEGSFHGDPDQGSRIPLLVAGGATTANPARSIETAALDSFTRLEAQDLVQVEGARYDAARRHLTVLSEDLVTPLAMEV